MSTVGQAARSRVTRSPIGRWAAPVVVGVVLIWSVIEFGGLLMKHTTGAELYGVLVAFLAVVAGAVSLWLLFARRRHTITTVAVLVLWAVIALGGVAGVVAHVVGPDPAHGPVDPRPRPIGAPLVFTLLGAAGGAALFYGYQRNASAEVS
jgi:hypothetical protein